MNIVALAGGVGGAKLVDGLANILPADNLTVIVNTGDDFHHYGLQICPDIDTVCYTLAGMANSQTGWGRDGESWSVFENLIKLSGPDWFRLGDQDLATHLERTRRMQAGQPLSTVVRAFCASWGILTTVLPMSDDPVETIVETIEMGDLPFQRYFVELACQPVVRGFRFSGIENARPAPGVLEAIRSADWIILTPSNPWVSIGPILAVPGIKEAVLQKRVVAVSPIIGGKAIKGPAAKMYAELGIQPSALAVAEQYHEFLAGFVVDPVDREQTSELEQWGIIPLVTNTIMSNHADRIRLAQDVIVFIQTL